MTWSQKKFLDREDILNQMKNWRKKPLRDKRWWAELKLWPQDSSVRPLLLSPSAPAQQPGMYIAAMLCPPRCRTKVLSPGLQTRVPGIASGCLHLDDMTLYSPGVQGRGMSVCLSAPSSSVSTGRNIGDHRRPPQIKKISEWWAGSSINGYFINSLTPYLDPSSHLLTKMQIPPSSA